MPQYKRGDMWSAWDSADLFVITTNSTLRLGDKNLVMGRGIALQAKSAFPALPQHWAAPLTRSAAAAVSMVCWLARHGLLRN
jgi:hypothetical protein